MDITLRIEEGKMQVLYQGEVIIPEVPYADMAMVGRLCCLPERDIKWMAKEKIFYKGGTFALKMVLQELLRGIEQGDPPTIQKAEIYFKFGYPDVCWFITELAHFGKSEQICIIKNMIHMTDTEKESQAYLQKWHYFNRYGMEMGDGDGYGT